MRSNDPTRKLPSAREIAISLKSLSNLRPKLALVLGSGFQSIVSDVQIEAELPYAKLPGFPMPTVSGHAGKLLLGHLGQTPVVILSGRAHYYEGYSIEAVTLPIRVLAEFGIRDLLLTNAAGGIRPGLRPGDLFLITDHINLMGVNPLRGPATDGITRFVDLSQVYDPGLSKLLRASARNHSIPLKTGVYLAVAGPSYETPAEIRAFARLGADAVGMSTVPEAIVARQCGLRVAGLSCITNLAAGRSQAPISHREVLEMGQAAGKRAGMLLEGFARRYGQLPA